ncbi:MAG: phosphoribosylamine--glycine ligase [Gammaproteobacteria bacterium]|nr:phosphoribosylamine--glycine ligase [Gammaproteobacteria bacterium]MCH9744785.1 phosphoribosylamine--glycine ligase [Gammaproteobacteria bacterium]
MKILIIGNGGREHALAWKVAQSNQVKQVWVAPGNAGTEMEEKVVNIDINATDIEKLANFATQNNIDLTIVGPEAALAAGIVNHFREHGLKCFGPTQQATQLESSKIFCKDFLQQHNIPTAHYAHFTEVSAALAYLIKQSFPIVIKADGLAAGKGVIIASDYQHAEQTVQDMLSGNQFGDAGHAIVIEEFLQGEELSYIVMSDGKHILSLASSQDHKRRDDGDEGPNTGGMGAYSPAPILTDALEQTIIEKIIKPTIKGMQQLGIPYTGFLYAGIMVTPMGEPKVLEFNCRLGDPETQPLLFRLQSDLVTLCLATLDQTLHQQQADWNPQPALSVVLTAGGYPKHYKKGDIINGLEKINDANVKVFHAGTCKHNNKIVTNGGRVLAITALGDNLLEAQQRAYKQTKSITWTNCYFRKDIGYRGIAR